MCIRDRGIETVLLNSNPATIMTDPDVADHVYIEPCLLYTSAMLLVNAVNTEGRPLEIFVKDGRIAAVGQELEALAGENETVIASGSGKRTERYPIINH